MSDEKLLPWKGVLTLIAVVAWPLIYWMGLIIALYLTIISLALIASQMWWSLLGMVMFTPLLALVFWMCKPSRFFYPWEVFA